MIDEKSIKLGYKFLTIAGILLVAIGIIFIFLKDYQYAYTQIILGLTFIIGGLFFKPTITWKEMPKGMKILTIFLWIGYFSSLWNIFTKFREVDFLLGVPLQFPISIIVKPILLLITLFTLIAIYRRSWWKLILWLQGFKIINFLAGGIWMISTPLNELYVLSGKEVPVQITQQLESLAKIFIMIPILMGLAIGIIVCVYIFKKKDYFNTIDEK